MSASAIITVGDELLSGRVVDTNAAWLSSVLRAQGFPTRSRETVGDEESEIAAAVRRALDRHPVVVVSGGLGPTNDDRTREGLAEALEVPLVYDEEAEHQIRAWFAKAGRDLRERDRSQARLPRGARPLENPMGTAPGIGWVGNGSLLMAFPGVPKELRAMVTLHLVPQLEKRADRGAAPAVAEVTVAGVGEAVLGERIRDLMERGRVPSIGSYPRGGDVVLHLEAFLADRSQAEALIAADLAELRSRLGQDLVAEERCEVFEVVGRLLLERGLKVAVAESITGGSVMASLVAVPGISAALRGGWVTYDDALKISELGVDPAVISSDGAVSETCAKQMAVGALRRANADLGVSATGIAGPSGATEGKPVGTVWFGVATRQRVRAVRRQIPGVREQVRERATIIALDLLRRELSNWGGPERGAP